MVRILTSTAIAATALTLSGCRTLADWGPQSGRAIPPGDVVAIGRLSDQKSETQEYAPDDLLGYGWFSAKFHITRVQSGRLHDKVIHVRYFGHTWFRTDINFRFRLRAEENGRYIICNQPNSSGYNCDFNEGT